MEQCYIELPQVYKERYKPLSSHITAQSTTSFNKILAETSSGPVIISSFSLESVAALESIRKDVLWAWQSSSFRQKKIILSGIILKNCQHLLATSVYKPKKFISKLRVDLYNSNKKQTFTSCGILVQVTNLVL